MNILILLCRVKVIVFIGTIYLYNIFGIIKTRTVIIKLIDRIVLTLSTDLYIEIFLFTYITNLL